jgi:UDP:flavonoid glycosyltransferase YjiC (YdhE family)
MKKIVIANEMGGGWGHLLPIYPLVQEFIQRGFHVSLLCRDDVKAAHVFKDLEVEIEKTPPWLVGKSGFSLNYAQNLWGNGYWDEKTLGNHFAWWTDRFKTLKPCFVLSDYAPTALLAALTLGIPRGAFGTGFTLPPMTTPMPGLHPWINTPEKVMVRSEQTVLKAIQAIVPRIESIAGIFEDALRFLEIFSEMDHFDPRPDETYWGPVLGSVAGTVPGWPDGKGPRIFIYLSSVNRCLDALVSHIKKEGFPTVCIVSGLSESEYKNMESPTFRLHRSFVDLHKAASQCDIAVTQGGMHTSSAMLLAGKQLLICPEQLEQTLLSYRLKQRGLCEFVSFFTEPDKVGERFDEVVASVELRNNAAAFSSKYAGYDSSQTAKEMVDICLKRI